jgi:hypothetical protein
VDYIYFTIRILFIRTWHHLDCGLWIVLLGGGGVGKLCLATSVQWINRATFL